LPRRTARASPRAAPRDPRGFFTGSDRMSEPSVPPPLPPTEPPAGPPPSTTATVVAVLCLLGGLFLLVPGGICSIMAIGMQFGADREASGIGGMIALLAVPAVLIGLGLIVFGVRKLRRKRG